MPEPIEIVIRKGSAVSDGDPTQRIKGEGKAKGDNVKNKAINGALVQMGKQIASYGISQYGNLTGDTITQRKIDTVINLASDVGTIAAAGWVGVGIVAVQKGLDIITSVSNANKSNQQANLLYERTGNITIDGGRGTNG